MIAQGSEVVYFELDPSGGLVDIAKQDLGQEVLCLDVGPIPDGVGAVGGVGGGGGRR